MRLAERHLLRVRVRVRVGVRVRVRVRCVSPSGTPALPWELQGRCKGDIGEI